MFYGLLMGACAAAPIAYLIITDGKNRAKLRNLEEQMQIFKGTVASLNGEIIYLKDNSEAKIAYKILKDNCRKMGTCHHFK